MEVAVGAASWVVGKALAPVTGGLLEAWAASEGLGPNVDALKVELLYAQAMLDNAREREIRSPALKELLHKLRQLAYDADDVLDELEYFRIQDELDGTYHAADAHAVGCIDGLALNARHTASAIAAKLKPSSCSTDTTRGEHDEQDTNAKPGCLSSVFSCGGRTAISSPPSPTNQDDQKANGDRNGRPFFCGALPSKVQGCLSGACLCSKRERSSAPPSPTDQSNKKVGCGCRLKVTSTASNTAKYIGQCLPCCSFQSVDENAHTSMSENPNMPVNKKQFICGAWSSKAQQRKNTASQAPEVKFNRVEISEKMKDITEHLKPVCAKVSNILNLEFMGTNRITKEDIAKKRPITTPYISENLLYGRDVQKKKIVDDIIHGNFANSELVVHPIVGPGGIGKTTFTQHVYEEVKGHFEVSIWICVSLNFNASKLAQEAVKKIPKVNGEKPNSSDQELIEQRLKAKRFLLVLDDMWACHEDEWKKLLAPFGRGGEKGSMVIVTTRVPEVAKMVIKTVNCSIEMKRLEYGDLLLFFEKCVFDGEKPWEGHRELRDVGEQIVRKLKGFPLEAKTVGRLLRHQLTLEHWTRVLDSKEWKLQTNDDDIMPVLKLSYDYLPFHLQQCFYYCALFPEDYEFESKELVHLWIGLDIVHPCDLNRRIEDVGFSYLNDLVNHGFFKENERIDGCPYYVLHDLLHNLAVNISSFECLSIYSSNVKSIQIPQDVRHLSIIVDDKDVEDIKTFKYYKKDLGALDKRLKVENLRTLMVFGKHHGSFVKTFCDLFDKARALRAIYLSGSERFYIPGAPYTVEDMLCNFSKLIHLRYLRIKSANMENTGLLSALSRLYHLQVIDLQEWKNCSGFTRHMNNLAKLRHFLVPEDKLQLHSNIVEVGKLRLLQELRSFEVAQESKGYEISQLGQLSGLGGSLAICSLERVQAMEEASEARLAHIKHLSKLTLEWADANQPKKDTAHEQNVLEILEPHNNLRHLCIRGHGGTKCPQWLGEKLSVKNLESLHLDGVGWNIFPPIGELWLVNGPHEEISSNLCDKKFQNLRRLELVKLPRLKKWVVDAPCQVFAHLEVLIIKDCSKLTELSFAHSICYRQHKEKEANMKWFPNLRELEIEKCLDLLSFPPIPWTSTPCSAKISRVASGLGYLDCRKYYKYYSLKIEAPKNSDSTFWNVLAFDNLSELRELDIRSCPPLPLHHFHMLSSLKTLRLWSSSSTVSPLVEGENYAEYQFPVERMTIYNWGASAKELTQLLAYFSNLSELTLVDCNTVLWLGVAEKHAKTTPVPPSSAPAAGWHKRTARKAVKADGAQTEKHQQQEGTRGRRAKRGEDEIAAEELLLLPPQLQRLEIRNHRAMIRNHRAMIRNRREMSPRSSPVDHNREAGRTAGGQGLQGLTSLRQLDIDGCPRLLSSYLSSSSSPCFPFPASLEHLSLKDVATLLPLSNLTSLTDLSIERCGDLRVEGLWPLLAQGRLTKLTVGGIPNFFAGFEHEQALPSSSSKLKDLCTDDIAGLLAAPIWASLSSSLTKLDFWVNKEVERFTKEQEEALKLLTSLERIRFLGCHKLQRLPAALKDGLPSSLQELDIYSCSAIRSVPKECLPSSLQKLVIRDCSAIQSLPKVDDLPSSLRELQIESCPAIRSLPKECLPSSLQKLVIINCPAIWSLPKVDDLPSSLRELNVCDRNSEELRRHCRKLIGTIPIVRA